MKFHFNSMREPLRDLTPGTPKWNEGYSAWLQSEFGRTETQGVSRVIEVLHQLLPHKPWNDVPLDKPCKRADVYFEGVTGKPWKVLVSLVQEYDPELAAEIQSYVHPENPGKPKKSREGDADITNIVSNYEEPKQHGNSKAYTLNRLRRDHGEPGGLFERVKAGELTANAAAIEAGFRKKPTPFEIVKAQIPKLTDEERHHLVSTEKGLGLSRAEAGLMQIRQDPHFASTASSAAEVLHKTVGLLRDALSREDMERVAYAYAFAFRHSELLRGGSSPAITNNDYPN